MPLNPYRVVVQLDRAAYKFLDLKGSIAQKYTNIYSKIAWSSDESISPSQTLNDMLILENEQKKVKVVITLKKFAYERDDIGSDIQFIASDVSRIAKEIDQEILSVEMYARYGFRFWYKVPTNSYENFILSHGLKIPIQNLDTIRQTFEPDNLLLRFKGFSEKEDLKYWVHVNREIQYPEINPLRLGNDITIDVDCYKEKIRSLSDLRDNINAANSLSNKLSDQCLREVLQWQKE